MPKARTTFGTRLITTMRSAAGGALASLRDGSDTAPQRPDAGGAGVATLDRADRLGEALDQLVEDPLVDRHRLAGRLGGDRRQALSLDQLRRQRRHHRPLGSRERCRR